MIITIMTMLFSPDNQLLTECTSSPSSSSSSSHSDAGADRDTVDMASGSQWILRYQPVADLVLSGAARLI